MNVFARTFQAILDFFEINPENYPDIRIRTDATTVMVMALAYASCWISYFFVYGFVLGSRMLAAVCLFPGLPTAVMGLYMLKKHKNIRWSSCFANWGGVTTVLVIAVLTGGSWSHQIVWCIAGVLATFLVQSVRAGLVLAAVTSVCLALISSTIMPQGGESFAWDFPFPIFSDKHAYFNALTQSTGVLLVALLAFTFKTRQAAALQESERQREQADIARLRAEKLKEQVEEHVRSIRSMLENTRLGLFSVVEGLSVHPDYARYLETILDCPRIAGESLEEVLLKHADLGPDQKNRILTAMEYALGEDVLFFEANASAFPRGISLGLSQHNKKSLDVDWVPVVDSKGNVEKVLVSVVDMTETLKFKAEAEAGRRNMQCLAELVELGPLRFRKFSQSATETWARIGSILQYGIAQSKFDEPLIREAYILLHTLKGVARLYKLQDITDSIHCAENHLMQKKMLTAEEFLAFQKDIDKCRRSHQHYEEAMKPLLAMSGHSQREGEEVCSLQSLFAELQEVADQLAADLGKIRLPIRNELARDLVLEPTFFKALADSMVHLLRNSLDHGIEKPEERRRKGLSEHGSLRVFLDKEGRLGIQDDGRGLALGRLKDKAAAARRSISSPLELAEMIFESGVSTKESVDDISGRGVGMDAVRTFLRRVGSDIEIVPIREEGDFLIFYFAIRLPSQDAEGLRQAS